MGVGLLALWVPLRLLPDHWQRGWLIVALLVLLAAEITGVPLRRFAGNFVIPPEWVNPPGGRAGLLWGLLLSPGLITQAPRAVFFGVLIFAVLQPVWWLPLGLALAFGAGRVLTGAVGPLRRALLTRGLEPAPWLAQHADRPVVTLTAVATRTTSMLGLLTLLAAVGL